MLKFQRQLPGYGGDLLEKAPLSVHLCFHWHMATQQHSGQSRPAGGEVATEPMKSLLSAGKVHSSEVTAILQVSAERVQSRWPQWTVCTVKLLPLTVLTLTIKLCGFVCVVFLVLFIVLHLSLMSSLCCTVCFILVCVLPMTWVILSAYCVCLYHILWPFISWQTENSDFLYLYINLSSPVNYLLFMWSNKKNGWSFKKRCRFDHWLSQL